MSAKSKEPERGPTITPEDIKRYFREGLTYKQMPQRWYEETGFERSSAAFSVAASRAGLKSPRRKARWSKQLPWRIKSEHLMAYEARMLRLLGAREAGVKFKDPNDEHRLDAFLRELDQDNKVVHYDPDTHQGFWCIPREPQDKGGYIHVRRQSDDEVA